MYERKLRKDILNSSSTPGTGGGSRSDKSQSTTVNGYAYIDKTNYAEFLESNVTANVKQYWFDHAFEFMLLLLLLIVLYFTVKTRNVSGLICFVFAYGIHYYLFQKRKL